MMKSMGLFASLVILAMVTPTELRADADPVRNAREHRQNETEIHRSKDLIQRDREEIENFQRILGVLDGARAEKNHREYLTFNAHLHQVMVTELGQAADKAQVARREVGRSRIELRRERREARQTGSAADRRQARDDRRDVLDDVCDLTSAKERLERMNELLVEIEDLFPAIERGGDLAFARNRDLIEQFLNVMIADLQMTAGELREDRQERREDRRERRRDRAG